MTMARHKAAVNCQILPWLSGKADCKEGRFLQTGNSLYLSKKFQELSYAAKYIYFCMALESGGKRKFVFTKSSAAKYGICSKTLYRQIKELEEHKFITVSSGKNTRTPNEFEFCFEWKKDAQQETNLSYGNISCITKTKSPMQNNREQQVIEEIRALHGTKSPM